jgi:hypothetical protein
MLEVFGGFFMKVTGFLEEDRNKVIFKTIDPLHRYQVKSS